MSIKEIKQAMEEGKVLFGVRQALKHSKSKGKNKIKNSFVAKDAREETLEKLTKAGVKFDILKPKLEMAKELNLDFESEVFSLK